MLIRDIISSDDAVFIEMCQEFYHSPAVLHPLPSSVFASTFDAIQSGSPFLRGLMIEEDRQAVGYGLLSFTFSAEVGGMVVLLEELYLRERCRGKGYGAQYIRWVLNEYGATAKRFRLEVTRENPRAAALYERLGFTLLDYRQMVLDL